jgi:6-phosphogluconolactonase (cycloisomerase 2 family)
MHLKRIHLYAILSLAAGLLSSSCTGFFTNTSSGSGSGNYITSTGTPSLFAYTANAGSSLGSVSAFTVGSNNTLTVTTGSSSQDANSRSIVSDSTGNYVYVADVGTASTAGSIDAYTVDRTTGALTAVSGEVSTASGATNPTALAINGGYVFAAYENSAIGVGNASSVVAFSVSSGILTQLTLTPISIGTLPPTSMAVDPSTGGFLYVTNGTAIYGFTVSTGTLTATSQAGSTPLTGNAPTQIVVTLSGKFAYVASGTAGVDAYTINASTGVLTKIDTYSTGGNAVALAVYPGGGQTNPFLYVVNKDKNTLVAFAIQSTGVLGKINSYSTGSGPAGIAIGPSGTAVYVANNGSSTVGTYTINSDGSLNFVNNIATDPGPQAIVVTP